MQLTAGEVLWGGFAQQILLPPDLLGPSCNTSQALLGKIPLHIGRATLEPLLSRDY